MHKDFLFNAFLLLKPGVRQRQRHPVQPLSSFKNRIINIKTIDHHVLASDCFQQNIVNNCFTFLFSSFYILMVNVSLFFFHFYPFFFFYILMLIKVVASGPGGVLPSSNYILTPEEEKEKRETFYFFFQKIFENSHILHICHMSYMNLERFLPNL